MPDHEGLTDFVEEKIKELITGAQEDIRALAVAITRNAVAAMREPPDRREALFAELAAQTLLLAEVQRLRAVNASWEVIHRAINAGISIMLKAADVML